MPRPKKNAGLLAQASMADLQAELARRDRLAKSLMLQRSELVAKIRAIDAQLGTASPVASAPTVRKAAVVASAVAAGAARRGRRRRAKNSTSLVAALSAVLKGKTMSVGEAAEAVRKAGYRSDSKHFRTMVNIALIKKDHFKRIAKGRYTAV
ncbi:MAG: hypothetical protein U0575_14390 [Phycisphaerales bacterium]